MRDFSKSNVKYTVFYGSINKMENIQVVSKALLVLYRWMLLQAV